MDRSSVLSDAAGGTASIQAGVEDLGDRLTKFDAALQHACAGGRGMPEPDLGKHPGLFSEAKKIVVAPSRSSGPASRKRQSSVLTRSNAG